MILKKGLGPEEGVIPGRKYIILYAGNIKPMPSLLLTSVSIHDLPPVIECSLYPAVS